jgi:uncharacterized membrane protein YozB (DUF420 family)
MVASARRAIGPSGPDADLPNNRNAWRFWMNTAVLEPRSSGARPGRGTAAAIGVVMLTALFFVAVAALPYFTFLFSNTPGAYVDEPQFGLYFPKRGWLLVHIAGGMVALLAGPVQLWLGLSDRRMDLHRRLGMAYIAGIAVGVTGAVALAVQTDLGWVFGAGLLGLSLAWVVTTGLAFAAIRKSLIEQHREWMIRSYVVTFAFVVFRIGDLTLLGLGVGDRLQNLALMAWACWAVPLLITEAVLQGRKIVAVRA